VMQEGKTGPEGSQSPPWRLCLEVVDRGNEKRWGNQNSSIKYEFRRSLLQNKSVEEGGNKVKGAEDREHNEKDDDTIRFPSEGGKWCGGLSVHSKKRKKWSFILN